MEQVRLAMLALPSAVEFNKTPPEGESWSQTVVKAIDGTVCATIGHVAKHIGDKVVMDSIIIPRLTAKFTRQPAFLASLTCSK